MKYLVRITPGDRGEVVEARRYDVREGGALVLWDGDLFAPALVRAYAPTAWHAVEPAPEEPAP